MIPTYGEVLKLFYQNIERCEFFYGKMLANSNYEYGNILSINDIEYNNSILKIKINPNIGRFDCLYDDTDYVRRYFSYSVIVRENGKYYIHENSIHNMFIERKLSSVPETKDEWFNHHIQNTRFTYEDYLTFQKICEYYDDISRST